jgi:hypothetical protein
MVPVVDLTAKVPDLPGFNQAPENGTSRRLMVLRTDKQNIER